MKRVLYYCQYLQGVGHLKRSLLIAEELAQFANIDFILGGPRVGEMKARNENIHCLELDPLLLGDDGKLYPPQSENSLEEVFQSRWKKIHGLLSSAHYDALIIEMFPFGRKMMGNEIIQLISEVREKSPNCKVICSLRDILVERKNQDNFESTAIDTLEKYFDLVLVHADPNIVNLKETFSRSGDIEHKLKYTGFVAEPGKKTKQTTQPTVLVSNGGGTHNPELLEAVAHIAQTMPQISFQLVPGPLTPPTVLQKLRQTTLIVKNLKLQKFSEDFPQLLAECDLALTLAGYNTMMNIVCGERFALVYPNTADREQNIRARKFEELGFVRTIESNELSPEKLSDLIRAHLKRPTPAIDNMALQGQQESARIVAKLIGASNLPAF